MINDELEATESICKGNGPAHDQILTTTFKEAVRGLLNDVNPVSR